MTQIVIGRRFCGPPNSGNGGYVCGVLAKDFDGPATAMLRAPVPLDVGLELAVQDGQVVMTGEGGALIGQGRASDGAELPAPPRPISLEEARAAGARHLGHTQRFHPICFTCGPERDEGDGLRVFAGQVEGREAGVVADAWTPHEAFADADGLAPLEVVWAALDCPGYFAWVEKEGRHGALLGTMTGEVLRRPKAGEPCVVMAWPLAREGRKETAGVALFSAQGELMARAHQVWIVMAPRPAADAAAKEQASA
ncbi:hypothetical protein [Phenylobacterium sp.]|uniref:hypothetical protein n=1 Tax=Phenylobacterium sp. TaxID=1871053 RepID=UPI002F954B4D